MATQTNQAIDTKAGVNSAYDTSLNAQKQALLNAYNTNTAAQNQQMGTVQQQGATLGNDVLTQNVRNQQNLNQFADVRNLNRQQGSQAALSLGSAQSASTGLMAAQQQAALAESKRQLDQMKVKYQSDVAAAIADNDYKRAAALLDDYNNQNAWKEKQAEILASYGNFDPYGELYGTDAAATMRNVWNAQNPDVAYRTGQIDAETYKNITGQYPRGYTPPSSGIDWGYYTGAVTDDELKLAGKVGFKEPLVQTKGQRRPVKGSTTVTPDAYKKAQQAQAKTLAGANAAGRANLSYAASMGVPIKVN